MCAGHDVFPREQGWEFNRVAGREKTVVAPASPPIATTTAVRYLNVLYKDACLRLSHYRCYGRIVTSFVYC